MFIYQKKKDQRGMYSPYPPPINTPLYIIIYFDFLQYIKGIIYYIYSNLFDYKITCVKKICVNRYININLFALNEFYRMYKMYKLLCSRTYSNKFALSKKFKLNTVFHSQVHFYFYYLYFKNNFYMELVDTTYK